MPSEKGALASILVLFGAIAILFVARRRLDVFAVEGLSMAPALLPGDWLVGERATYVRRRPRIGEVVVASDPRDDGRELVKRVTHIERGRVELRGDNPASSTDSAVFGTLPVNAIEWRIVARYWPPTRIGAVGRTRRAVRRRRGAVRVEPLGGEPACTFPEARFAGD